LVELLEPLLDDADDEVRYGAASYLLDTEISERASRVLEELAENPKGLLAPTARMRLDMWRDEH
jgi:hypothetical protein